MEQLLKLLEQNAKLTEDQLSALLSVPREEVAAQIAAYEKDNVLLGYNALVNWEKADSTYCTAIIELKVQPKRDYGYEEIAEEISRFDEVETVWLMSSSSYDLSVVVSGHNPPCHFGFRHLHGYALCSQALQGAPHSHDRAGTRREGVYVR